MNVKKLIVCWIITSIGFSFTGKKFKKIKWPIKEWSKTYYINVPSENYSGYEYFSGSAKRLVLYFKDSSIISIIIDPPQFDSLNRNYSEVQWLLKNENKYNLSKINKNETDSVYVNNIKLLSGQLLNGNYYKEIWSGRCKILYLNVKQKNIPMFETSLNSFISNRKNKI